jgi:ABC-type glutathione transport system ATPase component
MTEPVLSVRNLQVEFATRREMLRAINGVSFDIAKGEVLGVVGESGAGKSVTGLASIRRAASRAAKSICRACGSTICRRKRCGEFAASASG